MADPVANDKPRPSVPETDQGFAAERVLRYLRSSVVPSLPDSFGGDPETLLSESAAHGDLQAVIMAAMNVAPHLDRAAFTESTTVADVVAWIGPDVALLDGAGDTGLVERPRGSYATAAATLRPVSEHDVELAYHASLGVRSAHRWRFRGQTPSPEQFRREFFSPATFVQFSVVAATRPDGPTVGVVSAYNANLSDGVAYVAFQRFDESYAEPVSGGRPTTKGLMVEGLLVFFQYLFDHFTFRKIYVEVPEYNLSLFEQGAGQIFEKEGELADHLYFGDRYWSQLIFALYRETWDEVAEAFRGRWPSSHGTTHRVAGTPGRT